MKGAGRLGSIDRETVLNWRVEAVGKSPNEGTMGLTVVTLCAYYVENA
jgi:hypothetical protein